MRRRIAGFSLIELMVVLAIVALLLTLVAPRYLDKADRARESALQYNLAMMRRAIDEYRADKGRYPTGLDTLVSERYLRAIPPDPITERIDTWQPVPVPGDERGGIIDVKSGAPGVAENGSRYADW